MNLPVILLVLAALADIVSSKRVFDNGGVEANPMVAKLFGKRPPFAAMVAVKALATGVVLWYGDPLWCYVGAALWTAAAVYNWRLVRYAAIVLVLAGCQTHGEWRALTPAEIRSESKACRAVGMEPELIRENGRVMWVTCVESEKARKALGLSR